MKKLQNEIFRDIGTLFRALHSVNDIKYKEFQLQKGQFIFITRVCENPGITLVELARILTVDKSTVTKAVTKLMAIGYIEKRSNENDGRGFKLFPTEKALEVYDIIIDEENKSIELSMAGLTKQEKEIVKKLIEKMSKNTKEEWLKIKGGKR